MQIKLIFIVVILSVYLPAPVFSQTVIAQGNLPVSSCSSCTSLENEKIKYFNENKYAEFIIFLNNYKIKYKLDKSCLNYYKALSRYAQLGYLEEKQSWDEYFANGNNYRQEIVQNAQEVISKAPVDNCLRVKTRLLLWQFHRGQQDAFSGQALDELTAELKAYAKVTQNVGLIKEVADMLLASEEKLPAREFYKIYVDKLTQNKLTDPELKNIALGFYKERNLELAQTVYDIYIEKASKDLSADKFIAKLFEIANLFVYSPNNGVAFDSRTEKLADLYDMVYAEKIYALIEAKGRLDVFNQETIYLRAFNLEKMNDYEAAQRQYLQLTQIYPDSRYFDEATYKIAMINAYILADISEAQRYFQVLADKTTLSPHVISSFYQLGLLSQWQGNFVQARSYYDLLLKNAQDKYSASVISAKERLEEIQGNKSLSYNLKIFLDLSLKDKTTLIEMNKTQLRLASYVLTKNQNNLVSSLVNMPQSGCNQVELQYLWSGDLGGVNPKVTESSFQSVYADSGTKELNMVIISPAGAIDRSFAMVDVY